MPKISSVIISFNINNGNIIKIHSFCIKSWQPLQRYGSYLKPTCLIHTKYHLKKLSFCVFFYHTQTKICWRQHFSHLRPKFPEFYFIFLIFVKIIPWGCKFVLGFFTLIRTFCHMFSDRTQFKHWVRQQFWHLSEYCFDLLRKFLILSV